MRRPRDRPSSSVLREHDFRRLDDDLDLIAFLKRELIGALAGDYALNVVFPDANNNMRHDVPKDDFNDLSFQLVSGG